MPSVVWDYFEEFEGGGKCRLCGCIRNRKDKSTSTFWQHLERVHGLDKRLMLLNSPANSLGEGKKVKQTNNFNQINNYSNNNFNITQKRHLEVSNEMFGEEPVEKMPKLELMTELDKRATEETLKFISELVNQQQKPTESPQPCSSSNDWQNNNLIYSQNLKGNELNVKNEGINSCPISSPIGINFNNNFDYNQNSVLAFNKKVEPFEGSGLSFNGYMSGLLEGNQTTQNGSVHSDLKTKCLLDNNSNKKRSDYLNWEEFFMGSAILASLRSKDPCTQVGACIVKENKIVGTGYNGMPNGCNDDDMPWGKDSSDMFNTKYLYVCHAEMNAIANGNSAQFKDATIYITRFPCNECAKLIIQSGIKTVIYLKDKDCIETRASKRLFDATKVNYSQFQPIRSQIVINFE